VVLTGEGADEIFGGYNIFKEDKVRRFWAKNPASTFRSLAIRKLYGYVSRDTQADAFWLRFFQQGLSQTDDPYYSHRIRWNNTCHIRKFLSSDLKAQMPSEAETFADLEAHLNPNRSHWHPLCRAQYLELALFMPGYLLSSQGDRMMMANSVEGRVPFLDHRLVEFAATIPPKYKIRGLDEKFVLKEAFKDLLPPSIVNRPKRPYRAPILDSFSDRASEASHALEPETLAKSGYIDVELFTSLRQKAEKRGAIGERDEMAVAFIASLQLLQSMFVEPR
jgi:asparagine synthase (glutamine-hydrolysing)